MLRHSKLKMKIKIKARNKFCHIYSFCIYGEILLEKYRTIWTKTEDSKNT